MPEISTNALLDYAGILLLIVGLFLVLSGLGIFTLKGVAVEDDRKRIRKFGIFFSTVGVILLITKFNCSSSQPVDVTSNQKLTEPQPKSESQIQPEAKPRPKPKAKPTPTPKLEPEPQIIRACTPILISPLADEIMDNGRYDTLDVEIWDFDWSDCDGAMQYHLYVKNVKAQNPVINTDKIYESRYQSFKIGSYVADFNRHNWTWKVRAKVDGRWGEWSEERRFEVEPLDTDPPSR